MNQMMIRTDYGLTLSETVTRLARDVRAAAEEGGWAAAETCRLHAWIHAELVPWARSAARDLDARQRAAINPLIVALDELDAQMLGTAGSSAAELAHQLKTAADQLVDRISLTAAGGASLVPQQRDKVT